MLEEKSAMPMADGRRINMTAAAARRETALRITLEGTSPADGELLYRTFACTRAAEMAMTGWSAEQQESFLRMQFEAQRRSYLLQVPDAEYSVIRCNGTGAGRLILNRLPDEIHIVDICLLPEFQGLGIGSALMAAVRNEAMQSAQAVSLQVERFNPALQWYERLGFQAEGGGDAIYLEMVWRPAAVAGEDRGEARSFEAGKRVGAGTCLSI